MMSGFGLDAKDANNPRIVSSFVGKVRRMGHATDHLAEWAKHIVRHNLNALGFAGQTDVPLLAYINAAADARLDKQTAFKGLSKHFDLANVVTISRAEEEEQTLVWFEPCAIGNQETSSASVLSL
jgi:hypothetical protein